MNAKLVFLYFFVIVTNVNLSQYLIAFDYLMDDKKIEQFGTIEISTQ